MGVLLLGTLLTHVRLIANLDFDGENAPSESTPLYGLHCVRNRQPLYRNYAAPPLVVTRYMPLFYIVPGWLAARFDAGWSQTMVVGRSYVYVLSLGVGLAIYALARQARCSRRAAALAALLWLGGQVAPSWANSFRPDAAALFFSLSAVWVYQRGERPIHAAAAIGLLLAAFFHKQTAIVPLAVILVAECERRRFGRAAVMLAAWGVIVGVSLWAMQRHTRATFMMNTFAALDRWADWRRPLFFLGAALVLGVPAFSGASLGCSTTISPGCPPLWKRYFWLGLMQATFGVAHFGSWINYLLEPYAVGCVLTGILLSNWWVSSGGRLARWLQLGWVGVALASCVVPMQELPQSLLKVRDHQADRQRRAQEMDEILTMLSSGHGPVLFEDSYLALRDGPSPSIMDIHFFADLQRAGKFDDHNLLRQIERAEFKAIVTNYPLDEAARNRPLPLRWIEPMRTRYRLTHILALKNCEMTVYLYQPSETAGHKDWLIAPERSP